MAGGSRVSAGLIYFGDLVGVGVVVSVGGREREIVFVSGRVFGGVQTVQSGWQEPSGPRARSRA